MTATLHESPDSCAATLVQVKTANLPISEGADVCASQVSVSFLTRASLTLSESADTCAVAVSAPNVAPGITYMPPLTSLVNSEGTWTISPGGTLLVNGAATNVSPTLTELVSGTIYARDQAGNWLQRYRGNFASMGTVDPGPLILAQPPAFIGPSNTPNIWDLDLTDFQKVLDIAQYNISPTGNPFNKTFATDSLGINYMRFTNDVAHENTVDGSGATLVAWFLPLGTGGPSPTANDRIQAYVRWLLWIEDDVAAAFNEGGMKLPGLTSDTGFQIPPDGDEIYWRLWHTIPGNNTYDLRDYKFDAVNIQGQDDFYTRLKTNRWYCMELGMRVNDIGVSNGYAGVWLNGQKVYERSDLLLRSTANAPLRTAHINVYHGGITAPIATMHYRLAKIAASTSYIGVPSELLQPDNQTPAWRTGRTKDVVAAILNTASMAGNIPNASPSIYPTTVGKNAYDIDTWSGFAFDDTSWWGVCMGGHNGQWSNKAFKVDFSTNQPQFLLEYIGSNPATAYNADTGTTPIWAADQMDGVNAYAGQGVKNYYADGLPCSRHTYYSNFYVGSRSRVMMIYDGSSYGSLSHQANTHDAYNVVTKLYDPAGTWQAPAIFPNDFFPRTPGAAQHPDTEDIYLSNNNLLWKKWTASTGTWSDIPAIQGPNWDSNSLRWPYLNGRGSLVDASRNRWAWVNGTPDAALQCYALGTGNGTVIALTGNAAILTEMNITNGGGSAIVHDLDNDRYLVFSGDAAAGAPGRIFAINPDTGATTKLADINAPVNGWQQRATYFAQFGGVAFLPYYTSDIQFMPTR